MFALAQSTELTAPTPEVYGVLKRYASRLDDAEWTVLTAADENWLVGTAAQRNVIGSAHAQAWLLALGHPSLPEIILLPPMDRSPRSAESEVEIWTVTHHVGLTAYPNPTNVGTILTYTRRSRTVKCDFVF